MTFFYIVVAESLPNVNLHFEHKLTSLNLNEAAMVLTRSVQKIFQMQNKCCIGVVPYYYGYAWVSPIRYITAIKCVEFSRSDQTTVEVRNKAIIGTDGAYSLIRREMSKQPW